MRLIQRLLDALIMLVTAPFRAIKMVIGGGRGGGRRRGGGGGRRRPRRRH